MVFAFVGSFGQKIHMGSVYSGPNPEIINDGSAIRIIHTYSDAEHIRTDCFTVNEQCSRISGRSRNWTSEFSDDFATEVHQDFAHPTNSNLRQGAIRLSRVPHQRSAGPYSAWLEQKSASIHRGNAPICLAIALS